MSRPRPFVCGQCTAVVTDGHYGDRCLVDNSILVPLKTHRRHPNDPLLGQCLKSRYAVVDLIGSGGFGSVYRALDIQTSLHVAIKTIHPQAELGKIDVMSRFLQEVRILATLQSPRIVSVYDADIIDDVVFMVMELVEGQSLKDFIHHQGPLPLRTVASFTYQILEGLEHAHAHGLIHRDMKPANLLIDEMGTIRIIDFGVAKVLGSDQNSDILTESGLVMGTVKYMAPEQLKSGCPVGPSADLYALGIIIYEMLLGKPPFRGSAMEVAAAHLHEAVPQLPNTLASHAFNTFFNQSVQKSVTDRFASATEMRLKLLDSLPTDESTWIVNHNGTRDTEPGASVSLQHGAAYARWKSGRYDTEVDLIETNTRAQNISNDDSGAGSHGERVQYSAPLIDFGPAQVLMPIGHRRVEGPKTHELGDNQSSTGELSVTARMTQVETHTSGSTAQPQNRATFGVDAPDQSAQLRVTESGTQRRAKGGSTDVHGGSDLEPGPLERAPMVRSHITRWWIVPSVTLSILISLLYWQHT